MAKAKTYTVSDGRFVLNLETAEESGYIVTSPLDPELITEAETVEEAFENARDAADALRASRREVNCGELAVKSVPHKRMLVERMRDMDADHILVTIRIPKPRRRWVQISLGTLLLVILVIAIVLACSGRAIRRHYEARTYNARVYWLGNIGITQEAGGRLEDVQPLIREITSNIAPGTWQDVGGIGTIEFFPTNSSIVVYQKTPVHHEISELLEAKRPPSANKSSPNSGAR